MNKVKRIENKIIQRTAVLRNILYFVHKQLIGAVNNFKAKNFKDRRLKQMKLKTIQDTNSWEYKQLKINKLKIGGIENKNNWCYK